MAKFYYSEIYNTQYQQEEKTQMEFEEIHS